MKYKNIFFILVLSPLFALGQNTDNNPVKVKNGNTDNQFNKISTAKQSLKNEELNREIQTGIAFYNRAVELIKKQSNGQNMLTTEQLSDNCMEMFRKALPHLEKAHQADPSNQQLIEALAGTYFSLNETSKYQNMKSLLDNKAVQSK